MVTPALPAFREPATRNHEPAAPRRHICSTEYITSIPSFFRRFRFNSQRSLGGGSGSDSTKGVKGEWNSPGAPGFIILLTVAPHSHSRVPRRSDVPGIDSTPAHFCSGVPVSCGSKPHEEERPAIAAAHRTFRGADLSRHSRCTLWSQTTFQVLQRHGSDITFIPFPSRSFGFGRVWNHKDGGRWFREECRFRSCFSPL